MTPETQGQPEPVASIVHDTLHDHRWATRGDPPEKADPDRYTIRPLYDVDVPALKARQENLVEALERANDVLARLFSVDNGVSVNEVQEAHREIEAALAAAREES